MDEKEAIRLLMKKDLRGLTWIMEKYQVRALRSAVLVTRDRDLAEDVVQGKFVELYRKMRTFDPNRPFAPWFLRGVINAAIDVSHSEHYEMPSTDCLAEFERLADRTMLPETKLIQKELTKRVQESLMMLSPEQRGTIVMRYYLEMSEEEIAETAKVPKGTVKWRLHNARRRLQRILSYKSEKEE